MEKIAAALLKRLEGKKAVFLDLDNTVYVYEPCHKAGLTQAHSVYRHELKKISREIFNTHYAAARESVKERTRGQAASHSRLLYFKEMLGSSGNGSNFRIPLQLDAAYWEGFTKKMRRHRWVLPFLKECKNRGLVTVLITDLTTEIQLRKAASLGLEGSIDWIITSEEAGAEKPDARIFRLALSKAGCRRSDCLIIGDDPVKDCPDGFDFVLLG